MSVAQRITVADLVQACGGTLIGSPDQVVTRFAPLARAQADEISFMTSDRYRDQAGVCQAGTLVIRQVDLEPLRMLRGSDEAQCYIISPDPYVYFARAAQWLQNLRRGHRGQAVIHPTAVIDPTAVLAEGVSVGAYAVVGAGVRIAQRSRIGAHVVLGEQVLVGADVTLYDNVTIYDDCVIGDRSILHAGVVVGADGFGFAWSPEGWIKIPQVGRVLIGKDVEVGANTAIDRGALDDTVIDDGVKLDNLIQIGHNVRLGRHTAVAAHAAIAGSAVVGERVKVGGCAGIAGHLSITDDVSVGPMSAVLGSIHKPGKYVGLFPLDDEPSWERNAAVVRRLSDMRRRVKQLEAQVKKRNTDDGHSKDS